MNPHPHIPSADPLSLTSLANPRVKEVVRLRQRSHRDALGLMLIEGYREVKRALDNGYRPHAIFTCSHLFMGTHEQALIARVRESGAEQILCTREVFTKMSARDRPDGLLATGPQIRIRLEDLHLPPDALVVVAESIEKPGNLGTILRSSDAAGVHAVIVCDRCTDINNPNVVRASIGTLFALPVVEAGTEEALAFLRARGFSVLAATPHAETLYTAAALTGPTALVVGSEQYGLSARWLKAADVKVRIPMLGQCDSLNVAAATTILLFEATRQRIIRDPGRTPPPHAHEPHDADAGD